MSATTEISEQYKSDKIESVKAELTPTHIAIPKVTSNTHHVVVVGILIVLFTLYITATAIQRTSLCFEENKNLKSQNIKDDGKNFEKLVESEYSCSGLEVFVKDLKRNENACCGNSKSAKEIIIECELEKDQENTDENVFGADAEINEKKTRNGKNGKNGIGHSKFNNKTLKLGRLSKSLESNKKENTKKKNSTAEPIIYLFALVFIYLLIKAASDINQHYKSKTKGDKRLRRCSLQSYAQTHKQDRRASKDSPLAAFKHKQLWEQRSQSLDRYTEPSKEDIMKKTEVLNNLRKYISTEEPMQDTFQTGQIFGHSTSMVIDPIMLATAINSASDGNMSPIRRCSVPSLLTAQKSKLGSTSAIVPINRRSSIVTGSGGLYGSNASLLGSLGGSFDSADIQFPENKRRVRMINRH